MAQGTARHETSDAIQSKLDFRHGPRIRRRRTGHAELFVLLVAFAAALTTAYWVDSHIEVELSTAFQLPASLGFVHNTSAPHPFVGYERSSVADEQSVDTTFNRN